jgi:hypothetical protein
MALSFFFDVSVVLAKRPVSPQEKATSNWKAIRKYND